MSCLVCKYVCLFVVWLGYLSVCACMLHACMPLFTHAFVSLNTHVCIMGHVGHVWICLYEGLEICGCPCTRAALVLHTLILRASAKQWTLPPLKLYVLSNKLYAKLFTEPLRQPQHEFTNKNMSHRFLPNTYRQLFTAVNVHRCLCRSIGWVWLTMVDL